MPKEQHYIDMMRRPWHEAVKPARRDLLAERIRIAASCRDCDALPRVADAGRCFVDETGHAVQVMHNGLKVLYGRYYGPWLNEIVARLGGVHEPQEELVFHHILGRLPTGAVMVEAGAYWGYYSMWFAKAVRNARVFLVEPHPRQLETARKNFAINGLTGDFTAGYFGEYPEQKKRIQERRVGPLPAFSVESFMRAKALDRIALLHADIQGHEETMLADATEVLRQRRVDYLFVSTHGRRHPACRDILDRAGYRIVAEHDIEESASADGLLVAQNPELAPVGEIGISKVEGLVQAHAATGTGTDG